MSLQQVSSAKCFDGVQKVFSHFSKELSCEMKFGIYLPRQAIEENQKVPVVYFLSGLTCTEENFIQKSGFQRYASQHGVCVVNPDTSPRNVDIPGQDESYDFGSGAGFYVDATQSPWSKHYRMFSYVTSELISLIGENFPVIVGKQSILGHSMGGHGALICALKNPSLYTSISAFAPIANPMECPWGVKAFTGYLGENVDNWKQWDATELVSQYSGIPIELLIDQGEADNFYVQKQLLPENLLEVAAKNNHIQTVFKLRNGYDHGYFYVSSFIGEHLEYHAKFLKS